MIKSARRYQLDVSLCGEMASDPAAVLLLIGMGLDMLSLSGTTTCQNQMGHHNGAQSGGVTSCWRRHSGRENQKNPQNARSDAECYGLGGLIRAEP